MQYIGLLDCNNFFVSCERLFRPDLVGKPVAVLSGNDGCIVARSNEVKELGIPMGIPYFQVKNELKAAGVTIFSCNFTLYRDISARVMQLLQAECAQVEQYSVDEAFFSITADSKQEIMRILTHIKALVERQIGIPVSVGAAKSKTIAKYASEKEKRGTGVCVLTDGLWEAERSTLKLEKIWGVGAKFSQKLRAHGLHTVADLCLADHAQVERLFGVVGIRLRAELLGQAVYAVGSRADSVQKSIMSTRSFGTITHEQAVVEDALAYHIGHAAAELRTLDLQCRYLKVLARPSRHSDWTLRQSEAEQILTIPTSDTRVLLREAKQLLQTFFNPAIPYKKAGVILGMFSETQVQQADLFGAVEQARESDSLLKVMDALNIQFGAQTITLGKTTKAEKWRSHSTQLSPHYTTKWEDIASVST